MDKMVDRFFKDIYRNKRVLVTGHTGFKGSWLSLWLQELGAEVCGYALEPNTNPSHFSLLDLNLHSEIGDIRDAKNLNSIFNYFNPQIVFHLAAQPLVRLSYRDPIETYSTNVMGTLNVLEACRKSENIKAVIVVTSDKCYENKEWPWGYREIDPMGGFDPYSSSKGCVELLTASYRNSYFNIDEFGKSNSTLIASVRAGNVIGGGDWAEDRLIPDAIRAVKNKDCFSVRNPSATRPWQHVLEPLSGYLLLGQKLLEGNPKFAEAWNFGPEQTGTLTVGEVIDIVSNIWHDVQYESDNKNHPHEAGLLKLDCSKANEILKWKENLGVKKAIELTINWYKDYYLEKKVISEIQLGQYLKFAINNDLEWTK